MNVGRWSIQAAGHELVLSADAPQIRDAPPIQNKGDQSQVVAFAVASALCFENTWAPAARRGPGSSTPTGQGAVWQPAPTSLRHILASLGAPRGAWGSVPSISWPKFTHPAGPQPGQESGNSGSHCLERTHKMNRWYFWKRFSIGEVGAVAKSSDPAMKQACTHGIERSG